MDGPALGQETVLGTGVESTYGTPATVDRWFEFTSEGLQRQHNVLQSSGIRPGRIGRSSARRQITHRWAEGPIDLEVATTGFGRWLHQMIGGTVATTEPEDDVFRHVFELGSTADLSQTIQKVIRDEDGDVIETFTYPGSKVTQWELSVAVGEILGLSVQMDCRDEVDNISPAAHSYPTDQNLLHFAHGAVLIGDDPVGEVSSVSLTCALELKTDRFFLGSAGLKHQPRRNEWLLPEGSLTVEFSDPAEFYARYRDDKEITIVLPFIGEEIDSGEHEELIVEIPAARIVGDTPTVDGPGIVEVDVPFEALDNDDDPLLRVTYQTTDSSP